MSVLESFVVPIIVVLLHAMVAYGLVMRKRWAAYITVVTSCSFTHSR